MSDAQEASHYQVMVMQSTDAAEVAKLHAANPNLKVLMYMESLVSGPGDPQGWEACTEYQHDSSSWFLDDQNGNQIDESGRYLMDVGNAAYQEACVSHAIALAKQDGFNGIMFDSVDAEWQFDVPAGTSIPEYSTTASWQAAEQSFLNYAGPAVRAAGLLATANIGGANTTLWQQWCAPLDGAAEQGFTDDGAGLEQGSDWSTKIANAAWSEANDKYAILNSENETEAGNVYGLASMMLVSNGYSSYSLSNSGASSASNTSDENWYPEYGDAQQLGAATGSFRQLSNGVFVRQFQHGIVLVNSSGNAVPSFALGATYHGSTTPATSSIALAATSGAILLQGA